ncbi:hypothetical protein BRD09_01420 [Halobacteriales archaeon SW_10_68_16]|jgi:uncharacterized membrane protein|nr:MAG: hypothetical protein BRD09_01420 [Halobacteriales archaeon SW_10_68_16]
MADTARATDTGVGLSLVFGVVALLAALATFGTSYVSVVQDDHGMQVLSGIALAVTLLAAGLAVAAVHVFGE